MKTVAKPFAVNFKEEKSEVGVKRHNWRSVEK